MFGHPLPRKLFWEKLASSLNSGVVWTPALYKTPAVWGCSGYCYVLPMPCCFMHLVFVCICLFNSYCFVDATLLALSSSTSRSLAYSAVKSTASVPCMEAGEVSSCGCHLTRSQDGSALCLCVAHIGSTKASRYYFWLQLWSGWARGGMLVKMMHHNSALVELADIDFRIAHCVIGNIATEAPAMTVPYYSVCFHPASKDSLFFLDFNSSESICALSLYISFCRALSLSLYLSTLLPVLHQVLPTSTSTSLSKSGYDPTSCNQRLYIYVFMLSNTDLW